jgi:hypothetical protein
MICSMLSRVSVLGDVQVNGGVLAAQFAEDQWHVVHQRGVCRADVHASDPAIAKPPHRRFSPLTRSEDVLGGVHQFAPGLVGMGLLAEALDHLQGKTPLQLANLHADSRLGQIELRAAAEKLLASVTA